MKKRLVALVLCVAMLLGCTAVRAEADYGSFYTSFLSVFNLGEQDCRNSGVNRAIVALAAVMAYFSLVDNAYDADFTQPIYVSAFDGDNSSGALLVNFFSEDGHHIQLLTIQGNPIVVYTVDSETPAATENLLSLISDWSYTLTEAEINAAIDKMQQLSK